MSTREATLVLLRAELEAAIAQVLQNWGATFMLTGVSVVLDQPAQNLPADASEASAAPARVELHLKGADHVSAR